MNFTNLITKLNPFQSDLDTFDKAIKESNQIIQEINDKCKFNQKILDNINKASSDPNLINNIKSVIDNTTTTESTKSLLHGIDKPLVYQSMTEVAKEQSKWSAVQSIGDFCKGVMWIFQNPYECFKLVLGGLSDVIGFTAMVVCAGSILMAIFGHKQALKYIPIAMVIHILLKVVVSIL